MSIWGGEGIGEAMWKGIDVILGERARRQAQANADRDFAFKREQADVAQANADRTFNEGVRRADMAQANADREFGLKQDEAALKTDIAAIEADQRDRELALKERSQSWEEIINSEKLRQFQMQNDELAQSWRKKQEEERMVQETGRNQLAHGIYMMKHGSDSFPTTNVQIDGKKMEARVMPEEMRVKLVGTEGPLKDVSSFLLVNTDNGWVPAIQKQTQNGPQVISFGDSQQYDIFESVNKGFGDREMREYKDKRDLGMFVAKEEAKANAYNIRNNGGSEYAFAERATLQLMRDPDKADEIADYLGVPKDELIRIFRNTIGAGNATVGNGAQSSKASLEAAKAEKDKRVRLSVGKNGVVRHNENTGNGGTAGSTEQNAPHEKSVVPKKTDDKNPSEDKKPSEETIREQIRREHAELRKKKEEDARRKDDDEWGIGEYKVPQNFRGIHSKESWKKYVDKEKQTEEIKKKDRRFNRTEKSSFLGF